MFSSRDGFKGMRWLRQTLRKYVCAIKEMTQMTKERWTIRSVDSAIIGRVQSVQDQTGAGLGEIVSLAVAHGLGAAQTELGRRQPPRRINYRRMFSRYARGRGLLAELIRRLGPGEPTPAG